MRPRPVSDGTVTLAPITLEAAKKFPEWISDEEVARYLARYTDIPDEKAEEDWYQKVSSSPTECVWQIEFEGKIVGTSGIHQIDWINRFAETGTIIGEKTAWRKGIGGRSMILRAGFAFLVLNLRALETHIFTENTASMRATERCGYEMCGLTPRFERNGRVWMVATKVLTREGFLK